VEPLDMAETIDIEVEEPVRNYARPMDNSWNQPIAFSTASTFQSPFFWIVVGIGVTIAGYWFVKKKMN
jgi:lipoprotein signal peptidase